MSTWQAACSHAQLLVLAGAVIRSQSSVCGTQPQAMMDTLPSSLCWSGETWGIHLMKSVDILCLDTNLEDPVSPDDVDISPKCVDCPVWLGHGHHGLGLSVLEGGVPLAAEGDGHSEVLGPGLVRLHGSCVMVKWLPLTRVPVPVKSRRLF